MNIELIGINKENESKDSQIDILPGKSEIFNENNNKKLNDKNTFSEIKSNKIYKKTILFFIISILIILIIILCGIFIYYSNKDPDEYLDQILGFYNTSGMDKIIKENNIKIIFPEFEDHIQTGLTKKEILIIQKFIKINKKNITYEKITPPEENPYISVCFPIYNTGPLLHRLIKSIQNQNFHSYEIVAINDCSTDDSVSILENYMKEDKRIRYYNHTKNKGVFVGYIDCCKYTKGKYVSIIDSDDMYVQPTLFKSIYETTIKDNVDIIRYNLMTERNSINAPDKYRCDYNLNNGESGKAYYNLTDTQKFFALSEKRKFNNFSYYHISEVPNGGFWNAVTKREILLKVYNKLHELSEKNLGVKIYGDFCMSYASYKFSTSFKYLNNVYGYFYAYNLNSITRKPGSVNNKIDPGKYLMLKTILMEPRKDYDYYAARFIHNRDKTNNNIKQNEINEMMKMVFESKQIKNAPKLL